MSDLARIGFNKNNFNTTTPFLNQKTTIYCITNHIDKILIYNKIYLYCLNSNEKDILAQKKS